MRGFTKVLQNPNDLLDKLAHDLNRLEENREGVYAAFDFFITAEHMADWTKNKRIKQNNSLLKVVSHLANSAKHFEVRDNRHDSANYNTCRTTTWDNNLQSSTELYVGFTDKEKEQFGCAEMLVLDLAKEVFAFWKTELNADN